MPHATPRRTRARTIALRATLLGCSLLALPAALAAQDVRILRVPGANAVFETMDPDRPMIGITTASGSERADTLGLRIESVRRGSPAEKAGLKAGDRLQAANGTSLRADRADAGEEDYGGVLTRRLQRVVQATKPGESVTFRVLDGTTTREVRVTPVKASELPAEETGERQPRLLMRAQDEERAVLGLTVTATGSVRDTLGVFVQSVVKGGPAERAGIYEGDRIAAVGGVSLRVPSEDAEDDAVGTGRADRLAREVAKLKAGDAVELTVVSAGRSRTVRVTTVAARALPARSWEFRIPDGLDRIPEGLERMRTMVPDLEGVPPLAREMEVPGGRVWMFRTPEGGEGRVRVEEEREVAPRTRMLPRTPDGMRWRVPLVVGRTRLIAL